MPRGGARQGVVGRAYAERSDLQGPKKPAMVVPQGAPYGDRKQLVQAQQALPVAPAGTSVPTVQPPAPIGQAPPAQQQAPPRDFHRPTERPGEPVTHGLPIGPGAGPEALGRAAPVNTVGDLLGMIGASGNASPDVQALAAWAQGQPR